MDKTISPKLQPVKLSDGKTLQAVKPGQPMLTAPQALPEAGEMKMRLDSVITKDANGNNSMLQYFVYNDKGKEIKREYSYWNAQTNAWDTPYETYEYDWTDYGYVLREQVKGIGYGRKIEYVYNDQRLGIEQVIYDLGTDGEWVESQKGEYSYDDAGNIIEEYIYAWDGTEWANSAHNTATWDSKKRQTSITSYAWDGTGWTGNTKTDYVWFDGPRDPNYVEGTEAERMTYKGEYFWIDGAWHHYYIFENHINDKGILIGQAERYYNREYGNWAGGDMWNGRLVFCMTWEGKTTLDEHDNQILSETYQCLPDSSRWILLGAGTYDWEYAEDGSREGVYQNTQYTYDEDYNKTGESVNYRTYYAYNADNKKTWILDQALGESGELESLFEEKYTYNEQGLLAGTRIWDWVDGVRTPTSGSDITFNDEGLAIETITYVAESTGGGLQPLGAPRKDGPEITEEDEEGWANSTRWTCEYENGTLTEQLGYRWQDSQWQPNTGQSVAFDWEYPVEGMIIPEGWHDPYKIDEITNYTGDGNGGWIEQQQLYYYTLQEIKGVEECEAGNAVYFADNTLIITAGENIQTAVFDLTGKQVFSGTDREENLGHLNQGIYIVRCSVDGNVSTLKITIR